MSAGPLEILDIAFLSTDGVPLDVVAEPRSWNQGRPAGAQIVWAQTGPTVGMLSWQCAIIRPWERADLQRCW